MENKIYKLSDTDFIDLVKSSLNVAEVLFKLGYESNGNSWGHSQVKQRMIDLNLSGKDFRGKAALAQSKEEREIDPKKLFCKGSKHNRSVVRKNIIRNKLLPYKCDICGISQWEGKTLSLELDHINGENNDNRIENLRFLCPNCHSQTTTYGSKNRQLTESKYDITEDLRNLVLAKYSEIKNQRKVSKILNIKEAVVKTIISDAGLGKANQKYVIQYDCNMKELNRFGTISECCEYLMENNLVRTKLIKTCRNTLLRNIDKLWNEFYFKLLDV